MVIATLATRSGAVDAPTWVGRAPLIELDNVADLECCLSSGMPAFEPGQKVDLTGFDDKLAL